MKKRINFRIKLSRIQKFSDHLMATEIKKTRIKMNKLGASILDISKTFMYEFWYDYLKSE